MSPLFTALPGIALPVKEVTEQLAHMWDAEAVPGHPAPSEFRASQMNLVLHFGLKTTPEEAKACFDTTLAFARRYPCRVILLCPAAESDEDNLLQGKLFSQCYMGEGADMTCCEALILGYPVGVAGFLENQISVWLEPDLPVFHWLHRVPRERVEAVYRPFLHGVTRVIFDGQIDGESLRGLTWEKAPPIKDLAYARTLPLRQTLGQFLSGVEPARLIDGLREVRIVHGADKSGEAEGLLAWSRTSLQACADVADTTLPAIDFECRTTKKADALEVHWSYDGPRHLDWRWSDEHATLEADLGHGETSLHQSVHALSPRAALAEALFF